MLPVAPYAVADSDEEFDDGGIVDPKAALLTARMPGAMFRSGGTLMPGALMSGALLLGGPQVPTKRLPLAVEDPGNEPFRYLLQPDAFRETGLRCRRIDNHRPMLAVNGYRKETFVTGGMVVSADNLDEIYRAYDGFLDAAAASVADPLFGEKIVAAVVPRPGSDSSLAVFRAYLRGLGVSAHLIPERIVTVREIPRAGDGAVLRSAIATSMAA
jgi:acyl-CoA synthetase (AMP-forming)/AMP-acid ligase II